MAEIRITCPTCSDNGKIEVSEDLLKNTMRGILAVNISEGTICSHSFIAYIDRNFNVRDYFTTDYKIELPEIPLKEKGDTIVPSKNEIDVDLIKLNFYAMSLTYILKAIFVKIPLIIVLEHDFLEKFLRNFLDYITQKTFKSDISFISKAEIKNNKKKYKNHILIDNNDLLNDKEQNFQIKKLKVETQLIQNFLSEYDTSLCLIFLKNEIYKAYDLSKNITNIIKKLQKIKKKSFSILELAEIINNYANNNQIKLQKAYLYFIIDIITNYFEVEISEKTGINEVMRFL